jgi:hypothetical protein
VAAVISVHRYLAGYWCRQPVSDTNDFKHHHQSAEAAAAAAALPQAQAQAQPPPKCKMGDGDGDGDNGDDQQTVSMVPRWRPDQVRQDQGRSGWWR